MALLEALHAKRAKGDDLADFTQASADQPPLYDRIVIVGHSLGTIIAYDLLQLFWERHGPTHHQSWLPGAKGVQEALAECDRHVQAAWGDDPASFDATAFARSQDALFAIADPQRLHQVVVNLLANARVHTPAGTRVVTSLRREGDHVVIRVHDNGPGVPAEIQDRVFERFTRADVSRVRNEGGSSTGLGLAIVAAVVGALHGSVSVESVPGDTTFTVRLWAA